MLKSESLYQVYAHSEVCSLSLNRSFDAKSESKVWVSISHNRSKECAIQIFPLGRLGFSFQYSIVVC